MSALINALDSYTPKQIGENGHAEYTWSSNIRERILQFSFQLTRTDENGLYKLESVLKQILKTLNLQNNSSSNRVLINEYLILNDIDFSNLPQIIELQKKLQIKMMSFGKYNNSIEGTDSLQSSILFSVY